MEYLPDDIFSVEYFELENGMKVTLKKTSVSKNVEFRMHVHYGLDHEPCGRQELPHLLEHLVFSKANGLDEIELERYLIDMGTSSNATTSQEYTTYQTNVFNEFDKAIIDYLSWIMFQAEFTQENFRKSVDIVHRETRGEPNWFYDTLVSNGYLKGSYQLMMEDLGIYCSEPDYADQLTLEDTLTSYRRWYNPANMHLMIAGDYSVDLPEYIRKTFGHYAAGDINKNLTIDAYLPPRDEYESSFKPFVSQESFVAIGLFLGKMEWHELFQLNLLVDDFNEKIFNEFRVDKALAYSPYVDVDTVYETEEFAIFFNIDVDRLKTDESIEQLEAFIDKVIAEPMDQETFEKRQLSQLRNLSTFEATNERLVNFYSRFKFKTGEELKAKNFEKAIKDLDLESVNRLLARMEKSPRVKLIDSPVMDYWQLGSLLAFLTMLLVAVSIYRHKHRFLKKPVSGT